jgi:hypothetical protein
MTLDVDRGMMGKGNWICISAAEAAAAAAAANSRWKEMTNFTLYYKKSVDKTA